MTNPYIAQRKAFMQVTHLLNYYRNNNVLSLPLNKIVVVVTENYPVSVECIRKRIKMLCEVNQDFIIKNEIIYFKKEDVEEVKSNDGIE